MKELWLKSNGVKVLRSECFLVNRFGIGRSFPMNTAALISKNNSFLLNAESKEIKDIRGLRKRI